MGNPQDSRDAHADDKTMKATSGSTRRVVPFGRMNGFYVFMVTWGTSRWLTKILLDMVAGRICLTLSCTVVLSVF